MRQAHVERRFDFRGADFFDRWWWHRLHWTLEGLEAENANRVETIRQNLHAGAITYGAGQEVFDCHWNQAQELNRRIYNRLFPWAKKAARNERKQMAELWKKVWGDPADPEVQQKIEDTAAQLLASVKPARKQGGNHAASTPKNGIKRRRPRMGGS